MADYLTTTPQSTLHLSPNRKRTRDTRSANYLSASCKTVAVGASNGSSIEVMETTPAIVLPATITQPRSSIHSIQNGLSSVKTVSDENGTEIETETKITTPPTISTTTIDATSTTTPNGTANQQQQQPFVVSVKNNNFPSFFLIYEKTQLIN